MRSRKLDPIASGLEPSLVTFAKIRASKSNDCMFMLYIVI